MASASHLVRLPIPSASGISQCLLQPPASRNPTLPTGCFARVIKSTSQRDLKGTCHREVKPRGLVVSYVSSGAASYPTAGGNDDDGGSGGFGKGGHGGRGGGGEGGAGSEGGSSNSPWGAFIAGWNERVKADPSFKFKLLMEQVIGVTASVLGDMAGRPHFGIYELDFVFSTLIVGSILNFSLMYMLAPTGLASTCLPGIFANCPAGHLFEPGSYGVLQRAGTFVYKGLQFSAVGFAAGLVGTALTNVLLQVRKKVDPNFVGNPPPPMVLNAASWALHMGISSNVRYQTLNGLEFALAPRMNPGAFKALVMLLRTGNNVLGGISFSVLARITGSQKSSS